MSKTNPTKIHASNVTARAADAADNMRGMAALEEQRKAINDKIGVLRTGIGGPDVRHGFCPKAVKVIQQLQRMSPEELGRFDMSFEQLRDALEMPVQPILPGLGPLAPLEAAPATVEVTDGIGNVRVERGVAAVG